MNEKMEITKILGPGPLKVLENVIQAIQKYSSRIDTLDKLKVCVETIHEMVRKFVKFCNVKPTF